MTTRDFISKSEDSLATQQMLTSFLQKSSSEKDKEIINNFFFSIKRLKSGNTLPNIRLVDYNDKEIGFDSIITKPTVIYFWSSTLPLMMRNSHYKVSQLEIKFPNIDFIGININNDDKAHWKNILNQYKFPVTKEFQFKDPNEALETLAINSVNKSILVGKDSKIISANALIFTSEFEEQLKQVVHFKE
jgi:hypothetical protein